MECEAKSVLELIENVKQKGDQKSVDAIYRIFEESFKTSALIHFKHHRFDYEIAQLPDGDKRKERFIFSEAYLAFRDACESYIPSRCSFQTWLSFKIEKRFMGLSKKRYDLKKAREAMRFCEGGGNVSLGGYAKFGKSVVWRQYETDNHEPDALDASEADVMKALFSVLPKDGAAYKSTTALYKSFVDGFENQNEASRRLGISQQAVSKNCISARKRLPHKLQEKILEILRK